MRPLLVVDPDSKVSGANEPARELLGNCTGRLCWDVVGALAPMRAPVCRPGCVRELRDSGLGEAQHGVVNVRGDARQLSCYAVGDHVVVELAEESRAGGMLSGREKQVLTLVARGMQTDEIATQLGISSGTIRTHAESARRKLGARSRAQAVALALRDGDIDP